MSLSTIVSDLLAEAQHSGTEDRWTRFLLALDEVGRFWLDLPRVRDDASSIFGALDDIAGEMTSGRESLELARTNAERAAHELLSTLARWDAPAPARDPESGPGFARFTADDSPADVDRKMAEAFAPIRAIRGAIAVDNRAPAQLEAIETEVAALDQVVAAPPEPVPAVRKTGRPVRPLGEVMVPCDPGCGLQIPTSAIGAHRRECEAVKAFKAERTTLIDQGEWPRPLPGTPTDVVAARVEFEGKRAAASRSAAAATWDRNHQGEAVPKSVHVPISGTGQKRTPEQRERMRQAQLASYERRRAITQGPA